MYGGHPYDCATDSHPTTCGYCKQRVVYWECFHGSKVFFDPPDRGVHNCLARSGAPPNPSPPRASGKVALRTLLDVTVSVQPEDDGLMPGMERAKGGFLENLKRSWARMPKASERETVRVDPLGEKSETLVGEVSEALEIDIAARFGISRNSIGAAILGKTFPGLRVTQITILVDDSLNDTDAVDKMSYTAWCPADVAPSGIAKGASVVAEIAPREFKFMGEIGRRWVVESVDKL